MKARTIAALSVCLATTPFALADNNGRPNCSGLPTAAQLKTQMNNLNAVPTALGGGGGKIGGLFNGTRMWAAVVNRDGAICAVAASMDDPTQVWPGSQAIAKAKAYTANAFSLDSLALSTAKLYTFTQPGHSLWSLGQSNSFDPQQLAAPENSTSSNGQIAGGLIFFGGGVPLYSTAGKIIGGLGVSGDSSCADHAIAYRMRAAAGLAGIPGGVSPSNNDNIIYAPVNTPPTGFQQPHCFPQDITP